MLNLHCSPTSVNSLLVKSTTPENIEDFQQYCLFLWRQWLSNLFVGRFKRFHSFHCNVNPIFYRFKHLIFYLKLSTNLLLFGKMILRVEQHVKYFAWSIVFLWLSPGNQFVISCSHFNLLAESLRSRPGFYCLHFVLVVHLSCFALLSQN